MSLLMGNAIRAQLFQVQPSDPWVLGVAAGGVLIAATLASLVPARRAARVDPSSALRQD